MKSRYLTLGLFTLLGSLNSTLTPPVQAQVAAAPSLLNFQGRLTRPDGTPVADGTYTVRFSLHDAATGGNETWSQTLTTLTVRNGTFAALLSGFGSTVFDNNLWMEIKIGSDAPLAPRQQLVSVAYAMKANTVPDGSITSSKLAGDALNNLSWLLSGNSGTSPASSFVGTKDAQPLVFRTSNIERMRLLTDGKLGIGTTTPVDTLTVSSTGTAISAIDGAVRSRFFSAASGGYVGTFSNNPFTLRTGDADRMTIATTGNIGIGTGSPGAMLHVNGGVSNVGVFAGNLSPFGTSAFETNLSGSTNHAWYAESGNHVFSIRGAGQAVMTSTGNLQSHLDLSSNSTIGTWIWLRNTTTGGTSWPIWTSGSGNGEGAGKLFVGNIAQLTNGNVGIGISAPTARLDVNGSAGIRATNTLEFGLGVSGKEASAGKIGYQTFTPDALDIVGAGTTSANRKIKFWNEGGATFAGRITAPVVAITGGSDVAEPYNVAPFGEIKPIPGMVVAMDSDNVGKMKVASKAYDPAVGGILSGANGVNPGITLRQEGTIADGEFPVASVGRVWCWCDADANGPISTGTLLTSSETPGYAMRVTDFQRANGAVIGKAMSSLKSGKGLVLVLVSLK